MLYRGEEVESMSDLYVITTSDASTFFLTAKKRGTIVVEKSGGKWGENNKPCSEAVLNTVSTIRDGSVSPLPFVKC